MSDADSPGLDSRPVPEVPFRKASVTIPEGSSAGRAGTSTTELLSSVSAGLEERIAEDIAHLSLTRRLETADRMPAETVNPRSRSRSGRRSAVVGRRAIDRSGDDQADTKEYPR